MMVNGLYALFVNVYVVFVNYNKCGSNISKSIDVFVNTATRVSFWLFWALKTF